MYIYFILICIFFIFSIGKISYIDEDMILKCSFVILWFLATFRDFSIGNDTYGYYLLYSELYDFDAVYTYILRFEIGFLILNWVINCISDSFILFLGLINAFIYGAYYIFIKRMSCNYILSIAIFFLLGYWGQTLNILRVEIAVSILLYAYVLKNKYTKLSFSLAILSILFHYTSALGLLFYVIPKYKSYKFMFISIILVFGCIYFLDWIFDLVINIIPYYNTYLLKIYGDETKFAVIIRIMMHAIILLAGWKIALKNKSNDLVCTQFNMLYVSMLVMILATKFDMFDRCGLFFWSFAIVLIPNIIYEIKNMTVKLITLCSAYMILVLYFWSIILYRDEWNHIYPYLFINL